MPVLKVSAQELNQTDEFYIRKFNTYRLLKQSSNLFVHFDKTVYTNNETIWFSAYLQNIIGSQYNHTVLSIALLRTDASESLAIKLFPIRNGLSNGSITLPDNISPGNYHILAFTDVLDSKGLPIEAFRQSITIKSIAEQSFNSTIMLLDSTNSSGIIRAKINFLLVGKMKETPIIDYQVGNSTKISIPIKNNEAIITLRPDQYNEQGKLLTATVRYNGQSQYLSVTLPNRIKAKMLAKFYPEGGYLIDGIASKVGLEVKDEHGTPISISGILYKDEKPIDTLETNNYGIGSFFVKADINSNYILKIKANKNFERDTSFALTKALSKGLTLQLEKAIVNDTLTVRLQNNAPRKIKILLHNYKDVHSIIATTIDNNNGKILKILLNAVPKGISTITVVDEENRPLAERLFFAHYNPKPLTKITLNKSSYIKRDSVKVKISVVDYMNRPENAVFSVAAVQSNRIENNNFIDIESYVYLHQSLGNLPTNPNGRQYDDSSYLEDILLVRGWSKYTWQELLNSKKDSVQKVKPPLILGTVLFHKKQLKQTIEVLINGSSGIQVVTTDKYGNFVIDPSSILVQEGKNVTLTVNKKNKLGYSLIIENQFVKAAQDLFDQPLGKSNTQLVSVLNSKDQKVNGLEGVFNLDAVTIKGNRNPSDGIYGLKGPPGSNECGDYIDRYGFLNWDKSFGKKDNTQPIVGKSYAIRISLNEQEVEHGGPFQVRFVIYGGCNTGKAEATFFNIDGIYLEKEFYGTKVDNLGPQFLSTLYWKSGLLLNDKGESEINFVTGDITGSFRLVLQGVTNDGVIFGETRFNVK